MRIWSMLPFDFVNFFALVAAARLRGLRYQWPRRPCFLPEGFTGCSCSMYKLAEMRDMYRFHGWIPYLLQRTPDGGRMTLFIVPQDAAPGGRL